MQLCVAASDPIVYAGASKLCARWSHQAGGHQESGELGGQVRVPAELTLD